LAGLPFVGFHFGANMANQLSNADIRALTPGQREFLGVKLRGQTKLGRPKYTSFLTPAQAKVAAFMLLGLSQQQIAGKILLTKPTVIQHEREIRRRCGVATRQQAVAFLQQKYGTARNLAYRTTLDNRKE
jgi:DNA-binding CsgD family transcriptional regulator